MYTPAFKESSNFIPSGQCKMTTATTITLILCIDPCSTHIQDKPPTLEPRHHSGFDPVTDQDGKTKKKEQGVAKR